MNACFPRYLESVQQNKEMSQHKKSTKTPQTVDTIESLSKQISKASQLIISDEFDIGYSALLQTKIGKMAKGQTTFALKRSQEKISNLFAKMQITTIKTFKHPFYNKGFPLSSSFLRLPNLQNTLKQIKLSVQIRYFDCGQDRASFLGNDRSFTRTNGTIPSFPKKNERIERVLKNIGMICKGTEWTGICLIRRFKIRSPFLLSRARFKSHAFKIRNVF